MIEEAREDNTPTILQKMDALNKEKAQRIAQLLKERDDAQKSTEQRLASIGIELQALGWKKPRAKAVRKAVAAK